MFFTKTSCRNETIVCDDAESKNVSCLVEYRYNVKIIIEMVVFMVSSINCKYNVEILN